eukprot:scaffold30078_cov44-Cyclotella_meneghiniana.AAC.2
MVPRNHWTKERLLLHKTRLTKGLTLQSADEESEQSPQSNPQEALETEALIATNYQKHDIDEYIVTRTDLTEDQRSKLLHVLKANEQLFLGRRGNWKGQPVDIKVKANAKPCWAKPYPMPLKNRQVFEDEVYRQCDIGALHELTAEEIEDRQWCSPCFGVP